MKQSIIIRLNYLGVAYFETKGSICVQITHKLITTHAHGGKKIQIINYFRKCTNDGIIKGPFLFGHDLSDIASTIREINIFSEERELTILKHEFKVESITLSTRLKKSAMITYWTFLNIDKETHLAAMQRYAEKLQHIVSGNKLYLAVYIAVLDDPFKEKLYYCEATPEPHGLVVNVPLSANRKNFIFVSYNGKCCKKCWSVKGLYWSFQLVHRSWVDEDEVIEFRLDPLFYCFILKYWNRMTSKWFLPRPLIKIIISQIYPFY